MGAIIWQKVTTCNTTGGATIMGSFPYPRSGILKLDYEFILIFKKLGKPPSVPREIKENSKLSKREWNEYFSGHWNFPGQKQERHLAMFPEELPRRLIKMFSFIGDTVLDPFLGSGTTTLAACNLCRNSIGYEINEKFLPLIRGKIRQRKEVNSKEAAFSILRQENKESDFAREIKGLPYVFKDPVNFDKKIDPRKLRFGSRIDGSPRERNKYLSVREIISPTSLVLNDGLKIRLLGVRDKPEKKAEAIEFLRGALRSQKVFLKFDDIKYDKHGVLFCYLYLKNKTFINAHLIKRGLTDPEQLLDYKYRQKFTKLAKGR